MLDPYRDNMRLDIDHMSYEELLALGERIGNVSTGVSKGKLPKCIVTKTVESTTSKEMPEEPRCVICLEEFKRRDSVATLKACAHSYHVSCVKKWLSMKNWCPICKTPALLDDFKNR